MWMVETQWLDPLMLLSNVCISKNLKSRAKAWGWGLDMHSILRSGYAKELPDHSAKCWLLHELFELP